MKFTDANNSGTAEHSNKAGHESGGQQGSDFIVGRQHASASASRNLCKPNHKSISIQKSQSSSHQKNAGSSGHGAHTAVTRQGS